MTFRVWHSQNSGCAWPISCSPCIESRLDDLIIGYPLCSGQILIVGSFCQPNTPPHLAHEVQKLPFQPCGCLRRMTD